jgi:Flp pilus assembly protein TadG
MTMTMALALPAILVAGAVGIEMSNATATQAKLQGMADAAAVAAARELRLGNATADAVLGVARTHVAAAAGGNAIAYEFDGSVSADKRTVTVVLTSASQTSIGAAAGLVSPVLKATAAARVMGGAPVCAVALNQTDRGAIELEKQARVQAPGCSVYSNSKAANGLDARDSATLSSAFTCSAGGYRGGTATFTPTPDIDCPIFPDPLASRPAPAVGGCDPSRQNLKISDSDTYLTPGTYCGGIKVDKSLIVTLQPGIYIIKDGPLSLEKGARMQGNGVTLFFTGDKAAIDLKKESSFSLTAPTTGLTAGILMYQDRSVVADNVKFEISSDDATILLGTIYLPRGHLFLGGDKPVAQNSAYTIIIANKIQASAGPTLVLNTNYAATSVPVPQGVGPLSNEIALQR